MKSKATIKVKPITKKEAEIIKHIKRLRLKLILFSFIANLIIVLVAFVLMWKDNSFKPIPITIPNLLLIILGEIACTILLSTYLIFITCPKDSFLESKHRLICSKCRGRIYECTDGSYACWCGCKWSEEEVKQAIEEYNCSNRKVKKRDNNIED